MRKQNSLAGVNAGRDMWCALAKKIRDGAPSHILDHLGLSLTNGNEVQEHLKRSLFILQLEDDQAPCRSFLDCR